MRGRKLLLIFLVAEIGFGASKKIVTAHRLINPLIIDGKLTESFYQMTPGITDFVQQQPIEGALPTEKTTVWVSYDASALYVSAHLDDNCPDSIVARLGRRDSDMNSDIFIFGIDPYYDRRSGYYFGLSAAGTVFDGILFNDNWTDDSWDGIWQGAVARTSDGWSIEMRIPFSQLRFKKQEEYCWAINFDRLIWRKNEEDLLVITPKNESGRVSRFVDLVGINDIDASRKIEILPYFRVKGEYLAVEHGDPFNDGSRYLPGMGADFKIALGNNLTLDATLNPDFGQVEVDPAVINLSDVETFYQEKRPFFIEGARTFDFGNGGATNYWNINFNTPDFFYSRRLGTNPRGSLPDYDFASVPDGTHILTAGKLTGKIGDNWNIGVLNALTAREFARLDTSGKKFKVEVEPLADYTVLRTQKESGEGRNGLGIIGTYTHRLFNDQRLCDEFNRNAMALGVDGWRFIDQKRTLVLSGWGGFSRVNGTSKRMIDLQTNSRHYYHRPDAKHVEVDSAATYLSGYAGRIYLNKERGNVIFNSAVGLISPGFDVNDLGFLAYGDVINYHFGAGYRWTKPTKISRMAQLIVAHYGSYNFGGIRMNDGLLLATYYQFLNYYSCEGTFVRSFRGLNGRTTRGGPLVVEPAGYWGNLLMRSDARKPLIVELQFEGAADEYHYRSFEISTELQWKVRPNLILEFEPEFTRQMRALQYVTTIADPLATTFGNHYIFGELDQKMLAASFRLDWTYTPRLTLQLYAQPLIASGKHQNLKELSKTRSYQFLTYGEDGSTIDRSSLTIDPDGSGPMAAFQLNNPDFTVQSFRLSAVLRWEFAPGSTFYLVWTQNRFGSNNCYQWQLDQSTDELGSIKPDNILMIKMSYWFNR